MDERSALGTDALTGHCLGGRYVIGARLGGGGMAIVYRAVDERLHRDVAVKVLDAMRGADRDQRARFEIEARAAASITHPNVVAVHDFGIDGVPPNIVPYIVMECLPGRTLADELRAGPLPAARTVAVLEDILAALGAAHAKGVLHRDIKPGNVLLDEGGRVKLADFGIARVAPGDLTLTGMVMGTPAYLAPERVAGRPATVRSDLYAVGVLGYEALAGVRPFDGDSPIALAHAIHAGDPRPLSELRPDLPSTLTAPIMRALATDPADRPQSADEFRRLVAASAAPVASTAPVARNRAGADRAARGADRGAAGCAEARDPPGDRDRGARRQCRHRSRGRDDLVGRAERREWELGLESGCAHDGAGARRPGIAPSAVRTARALGPAVKRVVLVVVIASAVLLSACGTDDPSMTTAAATALQAQVADARTAVANAEYAHARELLDGIDARAAQLAGQGDLSDGRATAVRDAVAEVRAALDELPRDHDDNDHDDDDHEAKADATDTARGQPARSRQRRETGERWKG